MPCIGAFWSCCSIPPQETNQYQWMWSSWREYREARTSYHSSSQRNCGKSTARLPIPPLQVVSRNNRLVYRDFCYPHDAYYVPRCSTSTKAAEKPQLSPCCWEISAWAVIDPQTRRPRTSCSGIRVGERLGMIDGEQLCERYEGPSHVKKREGRVTEATGVGFMRSHYIRKKTIPSGCKRRFRTSQTLWIHSGKVFAFWTQWTQYFFS